MENDKVLDNVGGNCFGANVRRWKDTANFRDIMAFHASAVILWDEHPSMNVQRGTVCAAAFDVLD